MASKTLRFTLRIETELGEGDIALGEASAVRATIGYVTEWLKDNDYDYTEVGETTVSDA